MEHLNSHSVAYTLFRYREELRRRNARLMELSRTKLHLTQELVSFFVEDITKFSNDELNNLNREIMFTRKLKTRMNTIKKVQKLRAIRMELLALKF